MVSGGRQILGMALAIIGFLGSILTCALPNWKVRANIITAQVIWEGLWMNCVTQSTGQMKCKVYDPRLASPVDLQATRALVILAIIAGVCGILLGVIGGKCTNFVKEERQKSKVAIAAGVVLITAGLLMLIPISWATHAIPHDFLYNNQKQELGAALYIGWGSTVLLFLGGGLLCTSCPPQDENKYDVKYSKDRSVESSRAHV